MRECATDGWKSSVSHINFILRHYTVFLWGLIDGRFDVCVIGKCSAACQNIRYDMMIYLQILCSIWNDFLFLFWKRF